ncbi:MAG TPA: hypothetical protein VF902_04355 [Coriobacteriia bacterium]
MADGGDVAGLDEEGGAAEAELDDLDPDRQPLAARIVKSFGVAVVSVALILGLMHVVLVPVRPGQKTPTAHPGGACAACHFVSDTAKTIEVD